MSERQRDPHARGESAERDPHELRPEFRAALAAAGPAGYAAASAHLFHGRRGRRVQRGTWNDDFDGPTGPRD